MARFPLPSSRTLLGACLLGAASGLRSQMGMAAVTVALPSSRLPRALRRPASQPAAVLCALGELVMDKLAFVPARTVAPSLFARLGLGALSSGVAASTAGQALAIPAVIGAAAAGASTYGGLAGRSALARRVPPIVAALIEDLVAVGLAIAGVRLVASRLRHP